MSLDPSQDVTRAALDDDGHLDALRRPLTLDAFSAGADTPAHGTSASLLSPSRLAGMPAPLDLSAPRLPAGPVVAPPSVAAPPPASSDVETPLTAFPPEVGADETPPTPVRQSDGAADGGATPPATLPTTPPVAPPAPATGDAETPTRPAATASAAPALPMATSPASPSAVPTAAPAAATTDAPPVGSAAASALTAPTLPSVVEATATPVVNATPAPVGGAAFAAPGLGTVASPRRAVRRRSVAGRVLRSALVVLLAAGVGIGARFGWSAAPRGDDGSGAATAATAATALPSYPDVVPDAAQVVTTMTLVDDGPVGTVGTVGTVELRTDLATGDLVGRTTTAADGSADASAEGSESVVDLERRDGTWRVAVDGVWSEVDADDPYRAELDNSLGRIDVAPITFADVVPTAMRPYVTVRSTEHAHLDVVPLDAAALNLVVAPTAAAPSAGSVSTSASALVPTTHLRIGIDTAAFAAAAPVAHASWAATSWGDADEIDVWVDRYGVVRRLGATVVAGHREITWTSIDASATAPDGPGATGP